MTLTSVALFDEHCHLSNKGPVHKTFGHTPSTTTPTCYDLVPLVLSACPLVAWSVEDKDEVLILPYLVCNHHYPHYPHHPGREGGSGGG